MEDVETKTVEWYVSTYTFWHVRGALQLSSSSSSFSPSQEKSADDEEDDDEALIVALVSSDKCLKEACAVALGEVEMRRRADKAEANGDALTAALLLYAVELVVMRLTRDTVAQTELLLRVFGLLQAEGLHWGFAKLPKQ